MTVFDGEDEDDGSDDGRELHPHRYAKDDFVVSDREAEEEAFDPVRPRQRPAPQRRQQTLEELGPPISRDMRLDDARLDDVHQDIVHAFVDRAHEVEESLRNRHGLRRPLFTEQQYREMAIRWTTSVAQMYTIRGVDKSKVDLYGAKFASLVKDFHAQYREMMGQAAQLSSAAVIAPQHTKKKEIVDLISEDEDDDDLEGHDFRYGRQEAAGVGDEEYDEEDVENEGGFEPSRYFANPAGPTSPSADHAESRNVQQWHRRFEELNKASRAAPTPPYNNDNAGRPAGMNWRGGKKSFHSRGRGGRGGRGGYARGGGPSHSRASSVGGVSKRRGSVSRPVGRSNTPAGNGRSGKSASGANKSGPASGIATMPY